MAARRLARSAPAAALCAAFVAYCALMGPNVDDWFMLATGDWIRANGIPADNPFAPEGSDLPVTVQQWAYCALLSASYSAGGWPAVGVMNAAFGLLLSCSLSFAARSFCPDPRGRLRVMLPVFAGLLFDCQVRPHMADLAMWLFTMGAMQRRRSEGDPRYMAAVPALAAVHANLHLSMAVVDVFVAAVFALPEARREGGRVVLVRHRREASVLAAAAATAAAACATPYGPAGLAFPFWGSVGASYGRFAAECLPVWDPSGAIGVAGCAVLASLLFAAARALLGPGRVDLAGAALFAAALAATCAHVRFFSFLVVSWVPLLSSAYRLAAAGGGKARLARELGALGAAAMSCYLAAALAAPYLGGAMLPYDPAEAYDTVPADAAEAMSAAGASPGDGVLTSPSTGGYLEWLGYRVTMDSCAERWSQPLGDGSLNRCLFDYIDSANGVEGAAARYVGRWEDSVEWALVGSESLARADGSDFGEPTLEGTVIGYLEDSPAWERVYVERDGAAGQPVYVVYGKLRQPGA